MKLIEKFRKWNRLAKYRYTEMFRGLQSILGYNELEKLLNLCTQNIFKNKIEGDYLEFGVYEGDSFVPAYHLAKLNHCNDMKFYAFDSFQGVPKSLNVSEENVFGEGMCFCSLNDFKKNLIKRKVNLDEVEIVEGWYDDTLNNKTGNKLKLKKAAIIFIDCDLYKSTIPVLKFMEDYLQKGTIIIFDNWYYGYERKAFQEWLIENPKIKVVEYYNSDYKRKSFIVEEI